MDTSEAVNASVVGAAGGHTLITTAEDLARSLDAVLAGELFQKAGTLDEMLTFVDFSKDHPLGAVVVGYGLGLGEMGATVVMLCRSKSRGEAAWAEIKEKSGNENVDLMIADLAVQDFIRAFVEEFKRKYDKLHVLINNAGVTLPERTVTPDGIETTLAVNYLAPFLLTNLLLDVLKASAPARIIITVTGDHSKGTINFAELGFEQDYDFMKVSYQATLAKALFTYELDRRLKGTGVTANCLHPGATRTNLQRNLPWKWRLLATIMRPFFASPEKGAQTSIYLAWSPDVEGVSGKYPRTRKRLNRQRNLMTSPSLNVCGKSVRNSPDWIKQNLVIEQQIKFID